MIEAVCIHAWSGFMSFVSGIMYFCDEASTPTLYLLQRVFMPGRIDFEVYSFSGMIADNWMEMGTGVRKYRSPMWYIELVSF